MIANLEAPGDCPFKTTCNKILNAGSLGVGPDILTPLGEKLEIEAIAEAAAACTLANHDDCGLYSFLKRGSEIRAAQLHPENPVTLFPPPSRNN